MKKNTNVFSLFLVLLFFFTLPVLAAEPKQTSDKIGVYSKSEGTFDGPATTSGELRREEQVDDPHYIFPAFARVLKPFDNWQKSLDKKHNFKLGLYYTGLYQQVNNTLPGTKDAAAAGVFRLNGKWTITGRGTKNTGSLVFNVDNRHKLGTEISPSELASSIGYTGVTGTVFSDPGNVLTDIIWKQFFNNGNSGFIIGRFDPNDYVSVLGYSSPWTGFQNGAVRLNPSIALPGTSYGFGIGHWFNDNVYALGSINDANGTLENLRFFTGGSEFFSSIELGWTPSRKKRYTNAVNITFWNADKREDAGIGQSDGIAVAANWLFKNGVMPIFRAGWSNGDATSAPIYSETYTLGMLYHFKKNSDVTGIMVNWGENENNGLPKDQLTTEFFYNWSLSQKLNLTFSVQYLKDPALNPIDDSATVFGLRFRIAF